MSTAKKFKPKLLIMILASLGTSAYPIYAFAQQVVEEDSNLYELTPINISTKSLDEEGKDDVFERNVSNVYLGREDIERFKVDSAGDILRGLNGVYNMNTRSAGGAITPNIRGISGKGRIPVTIDGTEQTIDVWLNNYGVGDRNYLDPALFRSISVDKGPALTRGMKPGVGGSMAIRTIEPEDIIPEGDSWGFQINADTSNNKVQPQGDLGQFLGRDYREVGGTADGAGGGYDPYTGQMSPWAFNMDPGNGVSDTRQRSGRNNVRLGADQSYMVAGAFKTDITDGLFAYSHREKGNYFSGKNGADGYLNNPVYDAEFCGDECLSSSAFVPNMAKMFKPGEEVLNSSTSTETLLLKNNWYLPNNQKIALQYMDSDISFGEINPFSTTWVLGLHENNPNIDFPANQVSGMDSKINTKTYKLGYEWNPDNPWIDFTANLWRTKTRSDRHQSGGPSLAIAQPDPFYDAWYYCNVRNQLPPTAGWAGSCDALGPMYGFGPDTTKEEMIANSWVKNEDGKQNIIAGALQRTRVTRDGFDLSNRFQLSSSLDLTVGADFVREELDEQNTIINGKDLLNITGMTSGLTNMAGPRSGKRQEWGVNLALDWQATDRLNVQVGMRYHKFKANDRALAQERANRNERYGFGAGHSHYMSGVSVPYFELASDEEVHAAKQVRSLYDARYTDDSSFAAYQEAEQAYYERYGFNPFSLQGYVPGDYKRGLGIITVGTDLGDYGKYSLDDLVYYKKGPEYIIPFHNGKLDSSYSGFTSEMGNEKATNPHGVEGEYFVYLPSRGSNTEPRDPVPSNWFQRHSTLHTGAKSINEVITDEMRWAAPEEMRGDAFAPMIALTYRLGDNHRIFARYAQMTRFPSIYESTANEIGGVFGLPTTPGFNLKPERSRSWEIGWGFNFAPYFESLNYGDVRLTYFNNSIKDVIDTTDEFRITQYDERNTSGLEFQSRIDTGKYYASLGATYRLKQEMCDADTAFNYDPWLRRIPDCIEGSFGASRFYQALQPEYSINAEIGARLFDQTLEVGARAIYHSSVKNDGYDKVMEQGFGEIFSTTGRPYHWRPQLIVDLYGRYQVNKNISVNLGVTNITDRYYLDPMSNVPTPGPGRTVTLGFQASF